ncbi:ANTAR domain-containing protein [Actinoplanes sp. NPDC049265]|uniref:ANTAR domain-containing protein n=1 Tax=Actinoplanes sp. NPDC049265 TaxID=3363902 RepID=UPI00371A4773
MTHIGERQDLAERLGELARRLEVQDNVDGTLQGIAYAAVGTIPGAEYAGLMSIRRRREVITRAATDDLVREINQAQFTFDEGPCLDAARDVSTVRRLDDTGTEERWPRFTPSARELGVGSMMSFRLFVHRDTLGSLSLMSRKPHAFTDETVHVGTLFATHAAVAMSNAETREQLNQAISARDVIGQAKGILMERYKMNADQAFSVLARLSQDTNRRLVDIARTLTNDLT